MKKAYSTDKAPAAIGPYSQAVKAGDFVYVSGQIPIDPATGAFAGEDIVSQTRQSLTMDDVVKTTVLLADIDDFAKMNEEYAKFFTGVCPTRAAFEVAAIPRGALVEIEAVAYCG